MDLMERTNERRRSFMKDRLEHKLDDAVKDKIRLEEANDLLKQELDREQRDREQMLSAFQKGMKPQRSRFRRMLVLGAGVGAAYVYGARAGRGRYEEIVAWWDRMRGRASELQGEAQRKFNERTGMSGDMSDMEMGRSDFGSVRPSTGSTGVSGTSGVTGATGGTTPPSSGTGTSRSTSPTSRSTSKDATTGDAS
jgi:hypothetical protein